MITECVKRVWKFLDQHSANLPEVSARILLRAPIARTASSRQARHHLVQRDVLLRLDHGGHERFVRVELRSARPPLPTCPVLAGTGSRHLAHRRRHRHPELGRSGACRCSVRRCCQDPPSKILAVSPRHRRLRKGQREAQPAQPSAQSRLRVQKTCPRVTYARGAGRCASSLFPSAFGWEIGGWRIVRLGGLVRLCIRLAVNFLARRACPADRLAADGGVAGAALSGGEGRAALAAAGDVPGAAVVGLV